MYGNGTITNLSIFFPNAINDNGVMVGGHSIDSGETVQNLNSLFPARIRLPDHLRDRDQRQRQIVVGASDATTSQVAVRLNPS